MKCEMLPYTAASTVYKLTWSLKSRSNRYVTPVESAERPDGADGTHCQTGSQAIVVMYSYADRRRNGNGTAKHGKHVTNW